MSQKKLTFGETGIVDETPRVPLAGGMTFSIVRCEIRKSAKYDSEYVTIDGHNLEGEPVAYYSASGVIVSQCKQILERFGGIDGALTAEILCTVEERMSNNGRKFYTLA